MSLLTGFPFWSYLFRAAHQCPESHMKYHNASLILSTLPWISWKYFTKYVPGPPIPVQSSITLPSHCHPLGNSSSLPSQNHRAGGAGRHHWSSIQSNLPTPAGSPRARYSGLWPDGFWVSPVTHPELHSLSLCQQCPLAPQGWQRATCHLGSHWAGEPHWQRNPIKSKCLTGTKHKWLCLVRHLHVWNVLGYIFLV